MAVFLVTAMAAFALSMGYWSRESSGWYARGRFKIDATRTEWGLPRWLSFAEVRSSGAAPPISSPSLPAAGRFQPGWRVSPAALCLSVAGCVAVGLASCAIVWRLGRRRPGLGRGRMAWVALSAVTAGGAAAGWVSNSASDPENVMLTFLAIPLAVGVAAFFVRTYACGMLLATAATVGYWWASRMESLRTTTDGRFDPDEFAAMSVMLLIGLLVGAGATFIGRRRATGRRA